MSFTIRRFFKRYYLYYIDANSLRHYLFGAHHDLEELSNSFTSCCPSAQFLSPDVYAWQARSISSFRREQTVKTIKEFLDDAR